MKENSKKPLAIIGIIALSLLVAIVFETVFTLADKGAHPTDYSDTVQKYSKEYNVPEYIIYAIINVESGFDKNLKSESGASGLMQLTPATFRAISSNEHLGENLPDSKIFDPDVNIRYGAYYLSYLRKKFGNIDTALIAYHAGETNVSKWIKDSRYSDGQGNITNIPLNETKEHIDKLNKEINYYKNLYYTK